MTIYVVIVLVVLGGISLAARLAERPSWCQWCNNDGLRCPRCGGGR